MDYEEADSARHGGNPPQRSALDQLGLRDGKDTVLDYLSHGEPGLALEHLIYMVEETGIALSDDARGRIMDVASTMQMSVDI